MVVGSKESEDARIYVNPLVDAPQPDSDTAQADPLSLIITKQTSVAAGGASSTGASAQPKRRSAFDKTADDPGKQGHSGRGDQKAITSALKAPSLDYMQSPSLLGHGELFLDRVFTQSDWDAHISFRRYLPEPLVMYVPYLSSEAPVHSSLGS